MPQEARKKAEGELKKLKLMSPMSAEATVVRTYIDVLTGLPWSKKTKIKHDLGNAENVLERRPLRAREGQGPHRRIPRGAAARRQAEGAHPVPGRASRRGQDLAGPVHRQGDRPQVRAHGPGRHARRGGNPRPPPHLHRRLAGQGAAEPDQGRHAQPAVPARRDRQAGHRLPRRPFQRAAGGAGPGTEPHLRRPLRRGRLRPERRDVRGHLELDEHSAGPAGPHGSHPPVRATPKTKKPASPCATCCPSRSRTTA